MIRNFISKIQNSDETTKKFWLIIFSGATMALVVGAWVFYMSFTISKVEAPKNQETAVVQNLNNDAPGFFAIFSAGVKTIYDQLKEKFFVKNNIVIENPQRNFISENVKPIKPTVIK